MIDLHTHTTFSDGTDTPQELINKAVEKKIKYLAITDHDNIDANKIADLYCRNKDINFIAGIEFSINFKSGIFHLLGLNIDYTYPPLIEFCDSIKKQREERVKIICDNLKKDNIAIEYNEILTDDRAESSLGRPHIAKLLVEKKYAKTIEETFKKFLGSHTKYFHPKHNIDFENAIDLIHKANGISVIAHPLSLNLNWDNLEKFLIEKKSLGLDGVEVFHSGYTMIRCKFLEKVTDRVGLLKTAGSDYHGELRKTAKLGKASNGKTLSTDYLPEILK